MSKLIAMTTPPMQPTPLNGGLSDNTAVTPVDAPVQKKRRLQTPKLTAHDLTSPKAISSIIELGRATSEEHEKYKGRRTHANFLGAVIRRASRWAANVAPQHTLPEFVFASRTLAGSRPVRALVSNVRLAQLRGADVANNDVDADGLADVSNDDVSIENSNRDTTENVAMGNSASSVANVPSAQLFRDISSGVNDGGDDEDEDGETVIRRGRLKRHNLVGDVSEKPISSSGPVMADVPDAVDDIISDAAPNFKIFDCGTVDDAANIDQWEEPEDEIFASMEAAVHSEHIRTDTAGKPPPESIPIVPHEVSTRVVGGDAAMKTPSDPVGENSDHKGASNSKLSTSPTLPTVSKEAVGKCSESKVVNDVRVQGCGEENSTVRNGPIDVSGKGGDLASPLSTQDSERGTTKTSENGKCLKVSAGEVDLPPISIENFHDSDGT